MDQRWLDIYAEHYGLRWEWEGDLLYAVAPDKSWATGI